MNIIGNKLGNRYEIMEKLGGGGMAIVYKARDTLLNRVVTIKVLRGEYADDEEFISRFRHEAQAVASLSHPNIVNIYDVGYYEGSHFLVMEYVEGQNLKEVIRLKAPLAVEEAVEITKQICDGLEHAHENKIIHRDIKPHNILITKTGKVKVADFGLARAITTATVTHTKSVLGSVHYFSPEQAKGEITNEKSDIYSLGVVLYEMLTGQVPFSGGESPISVALKHIKNEPEALRKLNPAVPASVEAVIKKAMAKDTGKRYENIRMLKDDLIKALTRSYVLLPDDDDLSELEKTKEMEPIKMSQSGEVKGKSKVRRKVRPLAAILGAFLMIALIVAGGIAFQKFWFVPEVEVPDVKGLTIPDAERRLKEFGLELGLVVRKHDTNLPKDRIISQSPKEGSTVKQNRPVNVDVSEGPILKKVPDVQGYSEREAEIRLQNLGFKSDKGLEYNNLIPQGNVIRQLPKANDEEPEGSVVLITVSRGPEPLYIPMPDLIGTTLDESRSVLINNRLELGPVRYESSRQYFDGTVFKQNVPPQSLILQGETVTLVISSGPGPAARTYNVDKIRIPQDKDEATVKIVVDDAKGERVDYEGVHRGGELVSKRVELFGEGTIRVYTDGQLVIEWQLP